MQVLIALIVCVSVWFVVNFAYQVMRKPTELFFPVSGVLNKTPEATWDAYGSIFVRHSTATVSPELLAALAQAEGAGNPVARTYWRWSFTSRPFEVYKPASSAVGMYQITDGTFQIARRYCVHRHVVVEDGPWDDWQSCWFNALYSRVIPSNAVEMTAALLDRQIAGILAGKSSPGPTQLHALAAVIHLCGAGEGARFARRGFRILPGQTCGDHSVAGYVARIAAFDRKFAALRAGDE